MPKNINQNLQTPTQLERTLGMPDNGPKMLPITLDFQNNDVQVLDLQNIQSRGFLDMVQTIWVDNTPSAAETTITVNNGGQTLRIPPGDQGYFPILCPNPVLLQFNGNGGAVPVQVILVNFPLQAQLWNGAGAAVTNLPAFSTKTVLYGPTASTDFPPGTVLATVDALGYGQGIFQFFNSGANSVDVQINVANRPDLADLADLGGLTGGAIAAGGFGFYPNTPMSGGGIPFTITRFTKIIIFSDADGAPGTIVGAAYLFN